MNVLIGDIGNTNTKICLVELKTYKIKKLIHFMKLPIMFVITTMKLLKNFIFKEKSMIIFLVG